MLERFYYLIINVFNEIKSFLKFTYLSNESLSNFTAFNTC